MKHFRSYLSLILLLISFSICSQNYELGKVTVQELEEKEHPVEKDAAAAVLFTVGSTNVLYQPIAAPIRCVRKVAPNIS